MKQSIKIKEDSFFKGTYSGSGDMELYGSFEGVLNVKNLHIKKSGILMGHVSAKSVVVEGEMNADIHVENLHLKSTGVVDGEVMYRNIVIESGGLLRSQMVRNMSKLEK